MSTLPNSKPVASLGTLAIRMAEKAIDAHEQSAFDGICGVSLVLASGQIDRIEQGDDIDENKGKATFRAFLKGLANHGKTVWRDTEEMVATIRALRGKDRITAASDYVDGGKNSGKVQGIAKPEGARLVDSLARIRTYAFRLMKDALANDGAPVIRHIAQMRKDGLGADAQMEHWLAYVCKRYGATYNAMVRNLASDKAKKETSVIDAIMKRAEAMTDTDLAVLASRVNTLVSERAASAAEVDQLFTPASDTELGLDAPAEQESAAA